MVPPTFFVHIIDVLTKISRYIIEYKKILNKPLDLFSNKAYIKECTAYLKKYCLDKEE